MVAADCTGALQLAPAGAHETTPARSYAMANRPNLGPRELTARYDTRQSGFGDWRMDIWRPGTVEHWM